MNFWRASACFIIGLSICAIGWAQQFRQGQPDRAALSKAAVERHLQSKHPKVSTDPSKPTPGKYLLGRASARSRQLQSRIRATSAPRLYALPQGSTPSVFPGIQLRPALPAGAIANSVVTGDFNKDGHMDFVVANGGTNDLWIYFGNGDGTFALPQIIPLTQGLTPVYLAKADLRGIGVLDLIVAEFDTSSVAVLLGNGDGTFGPEQEYVLPQPPGALVVDDFNHDGKLDIVAVMVTQNSEYLAALLGDSSGRFGSPVISRNPGFYSTADSIVSGDVNNDGLPDVLITGPGLENSQVYINAGDGKFTPGATVAESGPVSVVLAGALADVNGDGCLDALVADGNGYVWIAPGDCSGNFGTLSHVPMGDSNSSLAVADLNGDGNLDLVTTTIPIFDPLYGDLAGNMVTVAFGDGHGHFASGRDYVGTGMSYSLAIADFNGDGHPDVVSASPDTDTATVYLNDGSGGFGFPQGEWIGLPGVGVLNAPISAPSFVDVNGDGKPDVVILDVGYNGEYFITTMLNDGTGRFAGPVPSDAGVSVVSEWMGDYRLGDFRNTGHVDFVGIGLGLNFTTGAQYIVFAPGNGDGTFGESTFLAVPGAEGTMGVGDFNRDGNLDFVAVGSNASLSGWVMTVFLGNGDGTFRNGGSVSFTDGAEVVARVFVGDFNRDGKLDVLAYDTGNGYFTTKSYIWEFLGNGDGTFQPGWQLLSAFQPMTMADVNGDSVLDIVRYDFMWPDSMTQNYGPAMFTTYLDQSSGAFAQSSSYAPYNGIPRQAQPYEQFGDPMTSSKVADLIGSGKPAEIAYQQVSPSNSDVYAQILAGNGNGTFTPTYDVFDFQKQYFFPGYSHIFDGTTVSDLLEINGGTSSMHIFKGGTAPSLQLALEQVEVIGNSGCGWVFLNVPSPSGTNVALSSSVSGVTVPASVTVPAGSLRQQFCYTLVSNYNWHQVFDIRAQLGADTAVAYAWQDYIAGFGETISPGTPQVIYPTQSTSPITVSLTSSQGYTSTVTLSCHGLPNGATCVFGSQTLQVSPVAVARTTVVVHTTANTQGGGSVEILATDGTITTRQSFSLTVQPLVVDSLGSLPETTSPGTATSGILIVGIPPYVPKCSGLPAGVTCSFSGVQEPYPQDTDLSMTVTVPSGIAPGAYPFNVDVKSGPADSSVGFTLYIGDFTLQAPNASNDWVPPGSKVNVSFSIQPLYSFSGTVNITCSLDVSGSNCTGGSFVINGSNSPVSVSITVPSGASPAVQTLSVTATDGTLSHTTAFPFYIADYSGSLSQKTLTIARGATSAVTGTVNVTNGFDGTVSFACAGTTEVTCSFAPVAVNPTPSSAASTSVAITASYSALMLSPKEPIGRGFWLLASALPLGIFLGAAAKERMGVRGSIMIPLLLTIALASLSCGGGSSGGGGGGGGSNTYSITVTAAASGTNTTRTLGTLSVTVTH